MQISYPNSQKISLNILSYPLYPCVSVSYPLISLGANNFQMMCVNCPSTGKLELFLSSSRGLFLNKVAVRRHIASSNPCHAADKGFNKYSGPVLQCHDRRGGAAGTLLTSVTSQQVACGPDSQSVRLIPCRNTVTFSQSSTNARGAVVYTALQCA